MQTCIYQNNCYLPSHHQFSTEIKKNLQTTPDIKACQLTYKRCIYYDSNLKCQVDINRIQCTYSKQIVRKVFFYLQSKINLRLINAFTQFCGKKQNKIRR